jgi:competence protein ComEC
MRLRRPPSLPDVRAALAEEVAAQAERWTLWTPVAFGLGAAAYLQLRVEPALWLTLGAALLTAAFALAARRWAPWPAVTIAAALIAFGAAGVAVGSLRTRSVDTPVAPASKAPQLVEGWVVDVLSPGASGGRLLIAPSKIGDLPTDKLPFRARISVAADGVVGPGAYIRLRAIVGPPPGPASPGSYDFARDAYFQRIGGSGFALTRPQVIDRTAPDRLLRWTMAINAARWSLARRVVSEIGGEEGGIAAAMVTGHEAWIGQATTDVMRASGLAHILSISGLHMAIVGGFVFAGFRLGIAAWPWLALRINGKKLAAVAGLGAVGAYLVLSGDPPPAERAAITAAIAFLAVLADRRAISLHALALAALVILAWQPEAASMPGFQMSFAATAALVALAEAWKAPPREISVPWPIKLIQGFATWLGIGLLASLVAGLATGPFALQYFNRVAVWGLPANLLVEPLSSFIFMPALALGAVLTPLGLGHPFLTVAGWGIRAMDAVAAWFAAAPYAQITVASAPPAALVVAFMGLMWLCLWRGRLRWLGLPLAFAVSLWPRPPAPDIWIASNGASAAVRDGKTALLMRPDVSRFGVDLWSRRRGLDEDDTAAAFNCNRFTCTPLASPVKFAASWGTRTPKTDELARLCASADIISLRGPAPEAWPTACKSKLVLTGEDFASGGSAELYRSTVGWRVVWAQTLRGHRPWTAPEDVSDSGG